MGEQQRLVEEMARLKAEWAAMSARAKRKVWNSYTSAIDEGQAGWHRFHSLLWPAWELGEQVLAEAIG